MKELKQRLSEFAKLGLVVAVSKPVYANMKSQNVQKARTTVKEFTRHNDKLGFDHSIPKNGYYVSLSPQFKESAYGGSSGFLKEAADFYTSKGKESTASHFTQMNKMFNMSARQGAKGQFEVPNDISDERLI